MKCSLTIAIYDLTFVLVQWDATMVSILVYDIFGVHLKQL